MAKRGLGLSLKQWELLLTELSQMSSMKLFSLQPPPKYHIYESEGFIDFELIYAWKSLDQRKRDSLIHGYLYLFTQLTKPLRLVRLEFRSFNKLGVWITDQYGSKKFEQTDYLEETGATIAYSRNAVYAPDCERINGPRKVIVLSTVILPKFYGRNQQDYLGLIRLARVKWEGADCGINKPAYSCSWIGPGHWHGIIGNDVLGQIDRDRYGKKIIKL